MFNRRGNTTVSTLLALMITTFMIPLVLVCMRLCMPSGILDEEVQDQLALIQLRRNLMCAYDVHTYGSVITYRREGSVRSLSLKNNRLIEQPGTFVFLSEVDEVYFSSENGLLYVEYLRDEKEYEALIGHL